MFLKLFHLSVVVLYIFTLWYDQMFVELPLPVEVFSSMPFKGRFAFLTIWDMLLQTTYFTLALLNDFIGTNEATLRKPPLIRKIKDSVFSLALPVALYVSIAFWTIFKINKDLLLPKGLVEALIPKWVNHMMHTAVTAFILIELFVTKRNYPNRKLGLSTMCTFMMCYSVWQHYLYFKIGVWMYPFLNIMNWPIRAMFYVVSAVFTISMYLLGEKTHNLMSSRPVYMNGTNDVRRNIKIESKNV